MTQATTTKLHVIEGDARLGRKWGGHDVRSEPEEGEEGGDAGEFVPGREVKFTELPLTMQQFDSLVGEHASRQLFNIVPGKIPERLFTSFSRLKIDDQWKNCTVDIAFGLSNVVKIEAATIKNVSIKFTKSGAELSATVVGARPRTMEMLDLEDYGGKPVKVTLCFGPVDHVSEQNELPLTPQVDATRVVDPASEPAKQETERQLGEALRGLESSKAA